MKIGALQTYTLVNQLYTAAPQEMRTRVEGRTHLDCVAPREIRANSSDLPPWMQTIIRDVRPCEATWVDAPYWLPSTKLAVHATREAYFTTCADHVFGSLATPDTKVEAGVIFLANPRSTNWLLPSSLSAGTGLSFPPFLALRLCFYAALSASLVESLCSNRSALLTAQAFKLVEDHQARKEARRDRA